MKNLEIRNITTEIRAAESGSRKITALAIPVNSPSLLLYENSDRFYETILPEAITEDLIKNNDIKLYLNHDESQGTFARSKYGEGSLHLFITERGLEFETDIPNTAFGDALLEGIRRGDYDAISFAFVSDESSEEWTKNEDGTRNRMIKKIDFLDEISTLSCLAAYPSTEVALRNMTLKDKEEEDHKRKLIKKLDVILENILE